MSQRSTWPFAMRPFSDAVGVEIMGVDVSSTVADDVFDAILEAFHAHGVLLFRGQTLSPEALVAFSHRFGEIEIYVDRQYLLPEHPEILVVGNVVENGVMKSLFVNHAEEWHVDMIFTARPTLGTLFYAVETPPEGADTLFAGAAAAYDALPEETRARLDGLRVVYDYAVMDAQLRVQDPTRPAMSEEMRVRFPTVAHPLVRSHPVTGRKALWLAPGVTSQVEGMGADEGLALVKELTRHATQPRFVYRHKWREGDLVVWDNRSLLHSATPFDAGRYRRVMHRTTIAGDAPV